MSRIEAPWTEDQVSNLNAYQKSGLVHEFTCGRDHEGMRVLAAWWDGWYCPTCSYRQSWAHDFMLDGSALAAVVERLPADECEIVDLVPITDEMEEEFGW